MIPSSHAAYRMGQIAGICLKMFKEQEDEQEQDVKTAQSMGVDAEARPLGIPTEGDTIYSNWHKLLQFYSTKL